MSSETTTAENGTSEHQQDASTNAHEDDETKNGTSEQLEAITNEYNKNAGSNGFTEQEEDDANDKDQDVAAKTIQRNYRGYKGRREMKGCGMSASGRWREVLKDAQFENLTSVKPKSSDTTKGKAKWSRLTGVAARAGTDEPDQQDRERPTDQFGYYLKKLRKKQSQDESMAMGLEYWLEMVDQKHRYGRNLLVYHKVWQEADTEENFFYWLDEGDGRAQDLEDCSRKDLDSQKIEYLSREERHKYLLEIDENGLLRSAPSGELVTTHAKDEDPTENEEGSLQPETRHHLADDLHNASALLQAAGHAEPALLTKVPQAKVPNADWIFVVDTQFRIYAGIKEKGGFQHSSFLHGSRVLSAGRIGIKDGLLLSLSPHSGHYRPTAENFWITYKCLEAAGVDMSQARIWDSYGILKGAEMYRDAVGYVQGAWSSLYDQASKLLGAKGSGEEQASGGVTTVEKGGDVQTVGAAKEEGAQDQKSAKTEEKDSQKLTDDAIDNQAAQQQSNGGKEEKG